MLPIDLIAALKVRWRLQLAILATVLALVAVWTVLTPKLYVASASLLFDPGAAQSVTEENAPQDPVAALVATQADVLHSAAIATGVARDQQLTASPDVVARWRATTGGAGDINNWYGRQLLGNLEVAPGRSSRVLAITYKSRDPRFAARMANAFVASYLDQRLRQQTDPARTYSRWFEDRTREVRSSLEQAQARLTAFQRKTGIVDTATTNIDTARLGELSGQLTAAEAASADIGARAGRSASASVDVQSSGVVQGLRGQISAQSAQLAQLSSDLGPNHPTRIAAEAELATLRGRLAAEIGTATTAVRVASGAASGKEGELRGKLDAQRGKMLSLANDRAELDVLQRDVDSARAAYDSVTQRLGTMRLQSEAPNTNVTQLDTAQPPLLPASPNVPIRMLLGLVLGGIVAIGAALAMEFWRPRIRTAAGTAAAAGAPVIASMNFSRSRIGPLLATGYAA